MSISEHRLHELHRQNRWLLFCVTLAVGFLAARELVPPALSSPGVLEASSFILRDQRGMARARLSIENQQPSFALLDEKGRVRAGLSLNDNGVPSLALFDEDANSVAVVGVTAKRSPVLDFYDKKRGTQATLTFDGDGKPVISLVSANQVLWRAP